MTTMTTISTTTPSPLNIQPQGKSQNDTSLDVSRMTAKQMLEKFQESTLPVPERAKLLLAICEAVENAMSEPPEKADRAALETLYDVMTEPKLRNLASECADHIITQVKNEHYYAFMRNEQCQLLDISKYIYLLYTSQTDPLGAYELNLYMLSYINKFYPSQQTWEKLEKLKDNHETAYEAKRRIDLEIYSLRQKIKDQLKVDPLSINDNNEYSTHSMVVEFHKLVTEFELKKKELEKINSEKNLLEKECKDQRAVHDAVDRRVRVLAKALFCTNEKELIEEIRTSLESIMKISSPEINETSTQIIFINNEENLPLVNTNTREICDSTSTTQHTNSSSPEKKKTGFGERIAALFRRSGKTVERSNPNTAPRSPGSEKKSGFGKWLSSLFSRSGKEKSPESTLSTSNSWGAWFRQKLSWFGSKSTVDPTTDFQQVSPSKATDLKTS